MKLKVMTIIGTRPEIIKLSCTVSEMEKYFDHTLVHTGQNYDYELNEVFFNDLGIRKPDYFLDAAKENPAKTIGAVISSVDDVMDKVKPDAVLLYGDTNSCLAVIAAKRRQIPIFHMEAGNRSFDQRVPEEINRKIVDHLSDINMVHCEHSRRYLLNEGIKPDMIIKTGTPMREVLEKYEDKIDGSNILKKLNLKTNDFFIVSIHREENVDYQQNFSNLLDSLKAVAESYRKRVIVSTHPRTRKRLEEYDTTQFNSLVEFMKPMGFLDYVKLQKEALCVISDSGTITEESSILGFPAIMIRQAHERPEGMDVGAVIMSGLKKERVLAAIDMAIETNKSEKVSIKDYEPTKVSSHVVKIIQSYTDFVNRTVWRKDNV